MAIIRTSRAEHVVPRIVSERAHAEEPGAVGIGTELAAATLRRYGGQTRRAPRRGRMSRSPRLFEWGLFFVAGRQQFRNLPRGQLSLCCERLKIYPIRSVGWPK